MDYEQSNRALSLENAILKGRCRDATFAFETNKTNIRSMVSRDRRGLVVHH